VEGDQQDDDTQVDERLPGRGGLNDDCFSCSFTKLGDRSPCLRHGKARPQRKEHERLRLAEPELADGARRQQEGDRDHRARQLQPECPGKVQEKERRRLTAARHECVKRRRRAQVQKKGRGRERREQEREVSVVGGAERARDNQTREERQAGSTEIGEEAGTKTD
jgi:hypothetical protein